jgi:hypothetical protein
LPYHLQRPNRRERKGGGVSPHFRKNEKKEKIDVQFRPENAMRRGRGGAS